MNETRTHTPKCGRSLSRLFIWTLAFLPLLALVLSTLASNVAASGAAIAQESGLPAGMLETEWKLIEIRRPSQDAKGVTDAGKTGTTLLFEMEGRVGGSSPCNTYSAGSVRIQSSIWLVGSSSAMLTKTHRGLPDELPSLLLPHYYSTLQENLAWLHDVPLFSLWANIQ